MNYYFVFYYSRDRAQANDEDGETVLASLKEAEDFVSKKGSNYTFRVIKGRKLEVTPVNVVTRYEIVE